MDPSISLARRRQLRQDATGAEATLWRHLRARRFADFKFRRQYPCGPFIIDFFCPRPKLAIELDGGQHFGLAAQGGGYEGRRTRYLVSRGITILRFPNDLVFRELDGVLTVIAAALDLDVSAL